MTANGAATPSTLKTTLHRLGNWLARLVEPAAQVTEPGTRRQVQLLSALLLAIVVLLIISVITTVLTATTSRSTGTLMVVTVVLVGAYFLSRTRFYQWATVIVVIVFSLAAFATALSDPARASSAIYAFLPIAFLIAGFLLPIGIATLVVITDTTIIFLLPLVISGYSGRDAGANGGIMMTLGAMILIFSVARNLTERDRLAVLTKTNQELQELQGTLEQRVEERTAQLRTSAEVGRAAASILDTEQLLQQTVDLIVERFGFYYAAIFTPDVISQNAILRAGTGNAGRLMKDRQHRLALHEVSMVGTAINTREPQIAQQVGAGVIRFANPLLPATQAEIALPLIAGGRVLGALDVQSIQPNAFDENTAAVLQGMANQIAVALSNSAQFEQTQIALQQARHIYEASVAVAEAANAQEMLDTLLAHAAPDADRGLIVVYGPTTSAGHWGYLEIAASWSRYADDPVVPTGMQYTAQQLPFISNIAPTKPLIIDDATRPELAASAQSVTESLNVKAAVGLGLMAGTVPVGVLFIAYRESRPVIATEVQPLQTLAGQIASALYNQRLAQETQAAFKQLDELNRRLTGKAWQEYARATHDDLRQIETEPGIILDDTASSALTPLNVPVTLRNEVIGNLRLEHPDRVWTPDDQALVETIADELAIAVENARLIEQTERRARREARLNQIAQQLRQATDIHTILQTATEELSQALDTSHAQAQLGVTRPAARRRNGEREVTTDNTI